MVSLKLDNVRPVQGLASLHVESKPIVRLNIVPPAGVRALSHWNQLPFLAFAAVCLLHSVNANAYFLRRVGDGNLTPIFNAVYFNNKFVAFLLDSVELEVLVIGPDIVP